MSNILLQADSSDPAIVAYIFVIILIIGLFFALRNLILWYYKLDVIAKNLEEQTRILKEISDKIDSQPKS